MVEDTGKRLKDVEALRGDMSAPAKLISNTLKTPPYTDEALDAVLEGSFVVDVYVNLDSSRLGTYLRFYKKREGPWPSLIVLISRKNHFLK
jgi:hypothetical protein